MSNGKSTAEYTGAGGVTVDETSQVLALTAVKQDTGYSLASDVVTQAEWSRQLIMGRASCVLKAGTDDPEIRLALETDKFGSGTWAEVPGGIDYAGFTNDTGVDECTVSFTTLVEGWDDSQYRLSIKTTVSGKEATVIADSVALDFAQIPEAWACAAWSDGGNRNTTGTFAKMSWEDQLFRDPSTFQSYTAADPMQQVELLEDGTYIVICNLVMHSESNPLPGITEGAVFHNRLSDNSGTLDSGFARRVTQHTTSPDGGTVSCQRVIPYTAATANKRLFTERRFINIGDATDTTETVSKESLFAVIRVDEATTGMDWFHIYRSATTTGAHSTFEVDYDLEVKDDGEFSHDNVTNNERVSIPKKKLITFANLNYLDSTSTNEHTALHGQFRLNGTDLMQSGRAGSGINYAQNGADPAQSQSDVMLGMIHDFSGETGSPYLEVQFQGIGTGTHASAQLQGGANEWGASFWGFVLDDGPDDNDPDLVVAATPKQLVSLARRPIRLISSLPVLGSAADTVFYVQNWRNSTGILQLELDGDVGASGGGTVYLTGRPLNSISPVILAGPISLVTGTTSYVEFGVPLMPYVRIQLLGGSSSPVRNLSAWLAE